VTKAAPAGTVHRALLAPRGPLAGLQPRFHAYHSKLLLCEAHIRARVGIINRMWFPAEFVPLPEDFSLSETAAAGAQ
jgi:hypothetical protein